MKNSSLDNFNDKIEDFKDKIKEELIEIKNSFKKTKRKTKLVNYVLGENEYKSTFKKVLTLDGKLIEDKAILHGTLKSELELNDYYGNNLDALYDMLGEVNYRLLIEIINSHDFKENLGAYYDSLIEVFKEATYSNDNIRLKIRN